MLKLSKPEYIIIHASGYGHGDAQKIRDKQISQGYSDIGFHAIIMNGRRAMKYNKLDDGLVEMGRSEKYMGAHCKAHKMNAYSIGVCLIGHPESSRFPTKRQMASLIYYLAKKCDQYDIPVENITQHSDWDSNHPKCANLDIEKIREKVKDIIE